jgi:hypothetical protein
MNNKSDLIYSTCLKRSAHLSNASLISPMFLNVSKKILSRESIFKKIDLNINCDLFAKNSTIYSDEQVKESKIYDRLENRI